MAVEWRLHDGVSPYAFRGTLVPASSKTTGAADPWWREDYDGDGETRFHINSTAPELVANAALLDGGALVRVRKDGTDVWAGIVRSRSKQWGDTWDLIPVHGIGIKAALLRRALVFGEYGLGRLTPDQRLFGFMAAEFNDGPWALVNVHGTQASPPSYTDWGNDGAPTGWVDPAAAWITAGPLAATDAPSTDYLRSEFTTTADVMVIAMVAADDQATTWVDGSVVVDHLQPIYNWTAQQSSSPFVLEAGAHTVAAINRNAIRPQGDSPMGYLFALVEASADGRPLEPVNVIHRSSSTWKGLHDPATPPGMTPGHILRLLVQEEQARNRLTGVTLGFTDAADSKGAAWPRVYEIGFPVGDSVQSVCERFVDMEVHTTMSPALRLDAWSVRRQDRTATVTLARTDCQPGGGTDRDDEIIDGFLVRTAAGWTAHPNANVPRIDFLSLGSLLSGQSASEVIADVIARMGASRDLTTATWADIHGPDPYIGFDVGDRITAPGWAGSQAQTVQSIKGTVDSNGLITWEGRFQP